MTHDPSPAPCPSHRQRLEHLFAGKLSEEDRAALYRHLDACPSCRALERTHQELAILGAELAQPDSEELAAVRAAVLARVAPGPRRAAATRPGRGLRGWAPLPALLAASVVAVVGFLAGQASVRGEARDDALAASVQQAASTHRSLAEAEDSPFLYSNVRLRPIGDGRVALSFDVTRHLEMVRREGDPLIGELLAQTLLGAESTGQRLAAIERSEGLTDPRVIEALTAAMLADPEPAVRLRALARLLEEPAGGELEGALLRVVEEETSIQMRRLAVDHLNRHGVAPAKLERALEAGRPAPGSIVEVRAASSTERYAG